MEAMPTGKLTAEDVLRPGSPWRDCELWDGAALVREPYGGWSEAVGFAAALSIGAHVREQGLGWTFLSSQGFLIARGPDRLLAPDWAFVLRTRLPRLPRRGFIPLAPDFALEVKSPEDAWEATVEKCGIWIAHGTRVAWAVNPETRTVAVFRGTEPVQVLVGEGEADLLPLLPGFRLEIATLFEGLEEPESTNP